MVSRALPALSLAVAAVALLLVGDGLGWNLDGVLFLGVGVGGALGLAPDGSPPARVGGFLLGVLAAAIGYLLRAAVLPDSTIGRAVALVIVLAVATGLVLLTFGRVPLWSALLGVGALGGAYEVAFTDAPGSVLSTIWGSLTSMLAMVAVGFAATVFFSPARPAADPRRKAAPPDSPPERDPADEVSLDDVLATGGR